MNRFSAALLLCALLFSTGCESDGPTAVNDVAGFGSLSALVNSVAFTAGTGSTAGFGGDILEIDALMVAGGEYRLLQLEVQNVTGTGTYTFSPLAGAGIYYEANNADFDDEAVWDTLEPGGSGQVVITLLTASRVEGTFSFVAPPENAEATGTKTVTNGVFSVIPNSGG